MTTRMTADDIRALFATEFPQVPAEFVIDAVGPMTARVRWTVREGDLRPGGTVAGPTMFSLADLGVYAAILAQIGPEALTVTTSAHIDFMRKPAPGRDLLGEVRLLKLGRALAVGEVHLHSEGSDAPVARASFTYSIPPARRS